MFADLGRLWSLARKVESLLKLQAEVHTALSLMNDRITKLDARMTQFEAGQVVVISEARCAAAAASTVVATSIISETITRLTRLENRAEQLTAQRLPPTDIENP